MSQLTICIVIFVLSLLCYALNKIPMSLTAMLTMAALIFYAAINLVTHLVVDISYGIIDPRIRLGGHQDD